MKRNSIPFVCGEKCFVLHPSHKPDYVLLIFFYIRLLFGEVFASSQELVSLLRKEYNNPMSYRAASKWLTVCLHYNEPWEEFLIKAVKPYIDVVLQTGVAERFYFQRSWERGPNIRLWFKGSPYVLENMLKPNLEEHFHQYFESRPSFIVEPQYPIGFPAEFRWFPNNSVQYFNYEPELDRFGGRLELLLCEKQFQASSCIVLKTLKEKTGKWTYNEMIGAAIKLHLSLAYAVGMSMEEAQLFFQWMADDWAFKNTKTEVENGKSQDKEAALRSFQKIFELQKKDIVPYHAALWELFKNYRKVEDEAFIDWFHINVNTSLELGLALESGKLQVRRVLENTPPPCNPDQAALWNFYSEFVFLTSNRLGIHSKNEGYLYYAIGKSLQAIRAGITPLKKAEVESQNLFP
jgi:hypothetical protein